MVMSAQRGSLMSLGARGMTTLTMVTLWSHPHTGEENGGIGDNTDTSHYRDVFPSVILTTVTWSKSPLRIINMDLRRLIDNLPRLQYIFLLESTL